MHPQQGVPLEGVEVAIQLDVVIVCEIPGALAPWGFPFVDRFTLQLHLHGHEVAIGGDQIADAGWLDVLELLLHQVQDHIRAGFAALGSLQAEIRRSIAAPAHGLAIGSGAEGDQLHLLGDHEARIEAQAEVANDGVTFLFVFFEEIFGAGERHLVDVALDLIGGHADAVVGDGEGVGFPVDPDADGGFGALTAVTAHGGHAPLANGIDAIAHQFPQENLMAAVNGLFDDREDVLGVDLNLALFQHRHGSRVSGPTLRMAAVPTQSQRWGVPRTLPNHHGFSEQGPQLARCRAGFSSGRMAPATGHTWRQMPQSMQVSKSIQ